MSSSPPHTTAPTGADPGPSATQPPTRPRRTPGPLARLLRWLALAALALVLGLLVLLVLVPRVMGWVPLTVLSGSMEPAIPAASQVVVDRVEGEEDVAALEVGDVIVFMPGPDDPTLVMHRVETVDRTGEATVVTTRGDANTVADADAVGAREIRGVVQYHVPWVGHVAQLLDQGQRQVVVVVLAGALLLYAAWQVIAGWRARR